MLEEDLAAIFTALEQERVRYLVVGGLAVIAHGHVRGTADLDLVVALDSDNATGAIQALQRLGYRPQAPVSALSFAQEATRQSWIVDKGMRVFQMIAREPTKPGVDLFVSAPFDFDVEYARATRIELVPKCHVPIVCIQTLIAMKREAGRPRDLDDIANLDLINREIDPPEIGI